MTVMRLPRARWGSDLLGSAAVLLQQLLGPRRDDGCGGCCGGSSRGLLFWTATLLLCPAEVAVLLQQLLGPRREDGCGGCCGGSSSSTRGCCLVLLPLRRQRLLWLRRLPLLLRPAAATVTAVTVVLFCERGVAF
jgi:hypothetical protein